MRQSKLISFSKIMEVNKVKKISLIVVLALVMVGAFAAVALADFTHPGNAGTTASGQTIYLPGQVPGVGGNQNYPIHSDYTANTDACAACHQVHTAQGEYLTQWSTFNTAGITSVCMTCHDGTVASTYNVLTGVTSAQDGSGKTFMNDGGLFAQQNDGANSAADSASQHEVFSGLYTAAAFGGAYTTGATASYSGQGSADSAGSWSVSFDCAACHTPHGQGGNSRILSPNPNDVMTHGLDPSTTAGTVGAAVGTGNGSQTDFDLATKVILGYPYSVHNKVYVGGTATNVNWIYNTTTSTVHVVFATAPANGAVITADYTKPLVVNFNIANKLTSVETVTYESGVNQFCGACHTDYNTESIVNTGGDPATTTNGTFSSFTRHAVGMTWGNTGLQTSLGMKFEYNNAQHPGSPVVTCLTCHFAHGVDQSRWNAVTSATSINYTQGELAGSSRLKRLPNMGVCEACHQKGAGNYNDSFASLGY